MLLLVSPSNAVDKEALFTDLVEPAVQGIKDSYATSAEECFAWIDKNEVDKNDVHLEKKRFYTIL